jgi:tRNA-binding EMAP/Myf-like protein
VDEAVTVPHAVEADVLGVACGRGDRQVVSSLHVHRREDDSDVEHDGYLS